MSEEKAPYNTNNDDLGDAIEMLGKGYEVHAPHVVLEMGDDYQLVKTKKDAYIKLSMSFKKSLPHFKGAKLAVFIAISLGINEHGESFPGINTLVAWTGYSRRGVIEAINELESMGVLTIIQGVKKSNLYKVNVFAAFGTGNDPVGAEIAPVQKTTQGGAENDTENAQNVLKIAPELESLTRVINKNETPIEERTKHTISQKTIDSINQNPEWNVLHGGTPDLEKIQSRQEALNSFERDLKFNLLPWSKNPYWERLERFVLKEYARDKNLFKRYAAWRNDEGKFEAMSNKQIYSNPDQLIATWPFTEVIQPKPAPRPVEPEQVFKPLPGREAWEKMQKEKNA
jgi:hypothetical protein